MPALRERSEDIPILAEYFVSKFAVKCKVKAKKISPEAMSGLMNYDWPGNVRELENAIERALVLRVSDVIRPEDLPESVLEKGPAPGVQEAKYHLAVKQLKKTPDSYRDGRSQRQLHRGGSNSGSARELPASPGQKSEPASSNSLPADPVQWLCANDGSPGDGSPVVALWSCPSCFTSVGRTAFFAQRSIRHKGLFGTTGGAGVLVVPP